MPDGKNGVWRITLNKSVVLTTEYSGEPLLVAGGGGGSSYAINQRGGPGMASTAGGPGYLTGFPGGSGGGGGTVSLIVVGLVSLRRVRLYAKFTKLWCRFLQYNQNDANGGGPGAGWQVSELHLISRQFLPPGRIDDCPCYILFSRPTAMCSTPLRITWLAARWPTASRVAVGGTH